MQRTDTSSSSFHRAESQRALQVKVSKHTQFFGTSIRGSDVVRFDKLGSSNTMASKALQSSWVQRLRPGGYSLKAREIEGTWAGFNKSHGDRNGSEFCGKGLSSPLTKGSTSPPSKGKNVEDADTEEESRSAIYPQILPRVESVFGDPVKVQQQPPRASSSTSNANLVTDTHVIAGFGPFQVRTRSLITLKPSESSAKKPGTTLKGKQALAPAPADHWEQYFCSRQKEETIEQTPRIGNSEIDKWKIRSRKIKDNEEGHEFRGGLLAPAPVASSYVYANLEHQATIDDCVKQPTLPSESYCRANHSMHDEGRLNELQWQEPQQQQLENNMWNVGSYKEIMPSARDHIDSGKQKAMDRSRSRRPLMAFANAVPIRNRIDIESVQYATPSSLPSLSPGFNFAKQIPAVDNCSNHCLVDQQAIWIQGCKSVPNVENNAMEVGNNATENCFEPSLLTPLVGPRRCGIAQELGRFESMEIQPFRILNYSSFENQKDVIIPSDNSSATVRLASHVRADIINRRNDRKKSSEFHTHSGTGSAFTKNDVAYDRPRRQQSYLEPGSQSSHYSNCPGPDEEDISTKAENRDVRFSKQSAIASDGWSDVKGKGSSLEKPFREQSHDREFVGGAASQYRSNDDAIHRTFQEKYTGAFSRFSACQTVFSSVYPKVRPGALHFTSKEPQEIDSVADGNDKGKLMKDEKISTMIQSSRPESPRNNTGFSPGKTILDCRKFHQLKARRSSAETGSTFQRCLLSSHEREAELDCDDHVKLKISAADGQTSSCRKRTLYTHKEIAPTNTATANTTAIRNEANAGKDCRPQMWLQRWKHSTGKTDLVSEPILGENMNCNSFIPR